MKAGRLDRRITIMRASLSANALNEHEETWLDIATVWASKEDISDSERIRAQEVSAEITTRFQIRHSSAVADVNPKDRVRFEGRVYDVYGVKEIPYRAGLEITATARAD